MERQFRRLLTSRQRAKNSVLCVGFDPLPNELPDIVRRCTPSLSAAVQLWMREIADATAPFMSLAKLQRAHWEAIDGGIDALRNFVAHMRYKHSDIPVFLDCKRGDIGRTQQRYRHAHFELEGVDGINYNGYMGRDTLEGLIDPNHMGRALVGLGRTSNPSAWAIQDLQLADGQPLWEKVVRCTLDWSQELGVVDNAGVVMGAAHKNPSRYAPSAGHPEIYSRHLWRARGIVRNALWLLITGIGTQDGYIEETIKAAFAGPGTIAVNSSSAITFASRDDDFADAAAIEAESLMRQMREAGADCQEEEFPF